MNSNLDRMSMRQKTEPQKHVNHRVSLKAVSNNVLEPSGLSLMQCIMKWWIIMMQTWPNVINLFTSVMYECS